MELLATIAGEMKARYGKGADALFGVALVRLLGLEAVGVYNEITEYYRGNCVQNPEDLNSWKVALQTSTGVALSDGDYWTDLSNVPALSTLGGVMKAAAAITFANGAKIQKGTYDTELGGNGGIEEVCSIEYISQWDAGRRVIRNPDGSIRVLLHNFNTPPDANYDSTKGFVVGSLLYLDNLSSCFECVNATATAAVWKVVGGPALTLLPRLMSSWLADGNTEGQDGYINTNLEWVGTPDYVGCGYDGQTFHFSGDSYLTLTHADYAFSSGMPFTVLMWVRSAFNDQQALFGPGEVDPVGFRGILMGSDGVLGFDITGGSGVIYGGASVNDSVWHMIAVTYDGTHLSMYRDGWRIVHTPCAGMNNTALWFGTYTAPVSSWTGDIDHISIYSGVLSDTEINAAYEDHTYITTASKSYDAKNLVLRRLGMPITPDSAARKADCMPVYRRPKSGTYFTTVQLSDMGGTIWTDQGLESYGALELPPLRWAIERGGIVRVRAARNYNDTEDDWFKAISVYANQSADSGSRFVFGNFSTPMYSLYNTGAGDYLELTPYWDGEEGLYWLVTTFSGLWEDRD